ncbi:PIN domain-containing protein [Ohtaekwangia koreensis]|uniref:DUF4935 domain-containing protein n=1 Tax=Ohtaekwangia koreensis TaxID=688867 RepID=A0A1T5J7S7_9BACT|nr:PIN domain-containing protein [Ohtaekwangia koreensis]SKC47475.1 hypothetical protein SAMN05660236_0854 [Ohtaekwangia koreensis]
MINLYIDTCCFVDLLTEKRAVRLIDNLQFWVSNERIKLFTHEVILKEWEVHKEKQRQNFKISQHTRYKQAREVMREVNFYVPEDLQPTTDSIDRVINRIDSLLMSAHIFKTADSIKIKCADRSVERKAPFHNKVYSTKDAYIIFSAIEHFVTINESFTFVSANTSDFGDPDNIDRKIHPQIIADYPGIGLDYYSNLGQATTYFLTKIDISFVSEEVSDSSNQTDRQRILIDREKPIIDQLLEYLNFMHQDIEFVPPRILMEHYPFIGNNGIVYYSVFNLKTSNKLLVDELSKVKFSEDGRLLENLQEEFPDIEEADKKVKEIFKYLTRDLIFYLSYTSGTKKVPVRYFDENECHCPICEFRGLNFVKAFAQLNVEPKNIGESTTLAYAHYRIGNYFLAANISELALNVAREKNLATTDFILNYNLSKLSIFLANNYLRNKEIQSLAERLSKTDLLFISRKCDRPNNKELLDYIRGITFYTEAKEKIFELHYKILEQYYESLRGAWSSNSYVWTLKSHYVEILSFINDNRIIYDRFNEFYLLSDRVFEAMLASHAISDESGSKLDAFDEWTMHQMILYGSADKLNKYFSRYRIKEIRYDRGKHRITFLGLLDNLLTDQSSLRESFSKHCEKDNRAFWDYYERIFCNAIVLFSKVALDNDLKNEICARIVKFLADEDFIHEINTRYIPILLNRVGKCIKTDTLISFFWVTLRKQKYTNESCIEQICELLNSRNEKLKLSTSEFNEVVGSLVKRDAQQNVISVVEKSLLVVYTSIESEFFKEAIREIVQVYLSKKFNFRLFYFASIFDVIKFESIDFNVILKSAIPHDGRKEIKYIFGRRGDRYEDINDLINLCFKNKVDTSSSTYEPIRNLGEYYRWLLNMDSFDYSKFEPEWIGEYQTKFYFKQIANSVRTKEFLESFLSNNSNEEIEKLYYSIFIRRKWEK